MIFRYFFKIVTLFFFSLITLFAAGQQVHFVYLQSDNAQPFYVKLNNNFTSSSSLGYLILPKLSDVTFDITFVFPKKEFPEEKFHENMEDYFKEIDKWVNSELPEQAFGYYCGLHSENFPPAEQLTDEEMILIRKAFEEMMYTWNQGIDFPGKLPVAFAYKIMVDSRNEKTTIMNSGQMNFDICSGYAPDCVFKESCPCLEFWNSQDDEDMDSTGFSDDELPF